MPPKGKQKGRQPKKRKRGTESNTYESSREEGRASSSTDDTDYEEILDYDTEDPDYEDALGLNVLDPDVGDTLDSSIPDPDTISKQLFHVERDEDGNPIRDERGLIVVSDRGEIPAHIKDIQHGSEQAVSHRLWKSVREEIHHDSKALGFDAMFLEDGDGSYIRNLRDSLLHTFEKDGDLLTRCCDYTGVPLRLDPGPFSISLEATYAFATATHTSGFSQLGYHAHNNCFLICTSLNLAKKNQTPLVLPLVAFWMRTMEDTSIGLNDKMPELIWCYNALQNTAILQYIGGFSFSKREHRFNGKGSVEGWRNLDGDQQVSILQTARTGVRNQTLDDDIRKLGQNALFSLFAVNRKRSVPKPNMKQDETRIGLVYGELLRIAEYYGFDEENFRFYLTIKSSSHNAIFYPFHVLSRPEAEQVRWSWDTTFSWINSQLWTLERHCDRGAKAAGVQEEGRDTDRMVYMMCHVLCKRISELLDKYPGAKPEEIRIRMLDRWGLPFVPWSCHPLRLSLCKRQTHGIAMETGYNNDLPFDPVYSFDDRRRTIELDSQLTNNSMANYDPNSWDNIRSVFTSVPLQHPLWSVDNTAGMETWGPTPVVWRGQFSPKPPKPNIPFQILLPIDPWLGVCLHDLRCNKCQDEHFNSVGSLLHHYNMQHSSLPYVCEDCGQRFHTSHAYTFHRDQDHRDDALSLAYEYDNRFKCPEVGCDIKCMSEWGLKNHIARVHKGERPFKCSESGCTKAFASKSELHHHIAAIHTEEKPFKCSESGCDKAFISQHIVDHHIATVHKRERPFKCSELRCDKAFGSKGDLNRHIAAVHKGERPIECSESGCDKAFRTKSDLDRHIAAVHKEERPFKCTELECGKAFKKRDHLDRHITSVHKGERPFKCSEPGCDQPFTSQQSLNRHIASVHKGERPFKCSESGCTKAFASKGDLDHHIAGVHKGERPFKCSESGCTKAFASKKNLNRHIASTHNVMQEETIRDSSRNHQVDQIDNQPMERPAKRRKRK